MKQVALEDYVNEKLDSIVKARTKNTYLPVTKKHVVADLITRAFKKECKNET